MILSSLFRYKATLQTFRWLVLSHFNKRMDRGIPFYKKQSGLMSVNTEPIRFSISVKLHLGPRMLFFCPPILPRTIQSPYMLKVQPLVCSKRPMHRDFTSVTGLGSKKSKYICQKEWKFYIFIALNWCLLIDLDFNYCL